MTDTMYLIQELQVVVGWDMEIGTLFQQLLGWRRLYYNVIMVK